MAISKTDICNQALQKIGSPHVMSIDDEEDKGARKVKYAFEQSLREVIAAGEWNCLKKRDTLGRLLTNPLFGWAYNYQLPSDFISMVTLNGVYCYRTEHDDWEIEGDKLLTDAEIAEVEYIHYNENATIWDPLFAKAVIYNLAAACATSIRQDEGMAQTLQQYYDQVALPKARMRDGNQRRGPRFNPLNESRFVAARWGYGNNF